MAARRHRIVVVLLDGMSALESAVAHDFLGEDRSADFGVPWYDYVVCSPDPAPVRVGRLPVTVARGLEAVRRADTVIVPGWGPRSRGRRPELEEALQRAHRRGARIVSFCTGAIALADAGLLDGRRATTHWSFGEEFRHRYPAVDLDPSVLYVDGGQVLTAAGAAASIDLALHLIRIDFGAEIANAVARDMVVPPHRQGGQAQYIDTPLGAGAGDEDGLVEAMNWATLHLGEDFSVADMAAQANLSPRQFTRRFRARTGTSPHQWVLTQRTALAQRLLETSDDPIERVAGEAGFGTAAALRLHFQRVLHTSPKAYRATFRRHSA